ncbi:MAG: NAD(P)-binding domain-containing protein, partial [Eubacteriaceae bacterium]|nr:NAD(P)-binding domain-containing protein [Eubacteriaceae bacterium]
MERTYGFIGCGNMGGTLAACAAKAAGGSSILVNDRDEDKALALQKEWGARPVEITELAERCDMIFLGVKPQMMED